MLLQRAVQLGVHAAPAAMLLCLHQLAQQPGGPGEVAALARIDDGDRETRRLQAVHQRPLDSAGRLDHHQCPRRIVAGGWTALFCEVEFARASW